jgi:hypothetical protein
MFRAKRDADTTADRTDGFTHSSGHDDLEALVDDHMLGTAEVEATVGWYPSRRGNSPQAPTRPR